MIHLFNRKLRLLMFSDIFLVTGFGLVSPILAVFISDHLIGGSLFHAGIAATVFSVTKAIFQLPISKYVDDHDNRENWLLVGTFLTALVPFVYMFSTRIEHLYLAQILYGFASALAYPTWLGLWSVNLDKKHESFEWSIYETSVGLGTAISASIGAFIAEFFGFKITFFIVGVMSLIACFVLLRLEKEKNKKINLKVVHSKRKKVVHKNH